MLFLLAVVVVSLCAVLYFFHRLRSLSKELSSLQTSLEGYVTLEEWEDSVQPSLSALGEKQQRIHRSLSVLSASVRGIREDLLWGATPGKGTTRGSQEDADDVSGQGEEEGSDEDDGSREDEEASLEAAQSSESNLQAMLFSMARLLQKEPEATTGEAPDAPAAAVAPRRGPVIAQARVLFGVPLAGGPSKITIEEDIDEELAEEEEEEEEPPAAKV